MIGKLKKYYPYIATLLGIIMISYALIRNPSFSESNLRFYMMKGDLDKLVIDKSNIISRREVNKYGVASIDLEIKGQTIATDDLKKLGWSLMPGRKYTFCKDGMIYAMSLSDQIFLGMKVFDVNFRYDAQTVAACK